MPEDKSPAFRFLRRLVLAPYWRLSRGMLFGVRGLVLDDEGRVLLIRHSYTPGWYLPGGGVERGETMRLALDRELAEEALIEATAAPDLFALYSNDATLRGDHVALFVVRAWRSLGDFKPTGEITGHNWFAPDALPDDATPGTRRRLDEVLAGAPVSEHW
ncbi:MAG: NUDIX domain-containing protein [Pseudomonadota bacterium]